MTTVHSGTQFHSATPPGMYNASFDISQGRDSSPSRYVDLAALSMSGSLSASVPMQLLIKYDPPKITLVYHFEKKSNDQYFHDIPIERNFLEQSSTEDIVSHLYMAECYYFSPSQIKRGQLIRLVNMLKENCGIYENAYRKEVQPRISADQKQQQNAKGSNNNNYSTSVTTSTAQFGRENRNVQNQQYQNNSGDNSPHNNNSSNSSPYSNNNNQGVPIVVENGQRRKNFFERKRLINYDQNNNSSCSQMSNNSPVRPTQFQSYPPVQVNLTAQQSYQQNIMDNRISMATESNQTPTPDQDCIQSKMQPGENNGNNRRHPVNNRRKYDEPRVNPSLSQQVQLSSSLKNNSANKSGSSPEQYDVDEIMRGSSSNSKNNSNLNGASQNKVTLRNNNERQKSTSPLRLSSQLSSASPSENLNNSGSPLPPLKGIRTGPISDPNFIGVKPSKFGNQHSQSNQTNQTNQPLPSRLTSKPASTNLLAIDDHYQQPGQINQTNPVLMENVQTEQLDEPLDDIDDYQPQQNQQQNHFQTEDQTFYNQNVNEQIYQGGEDLQIQNEDDDKINQQQQQDNNDDNTQEAGEGDEESVYMIQGVVCKKIQIEGESDQYLIDPQGRIYDMLANFIGTTTKECLAELGYPTAEEQLDEGGDPETDEDPQFYEDNNNLQQRQQHQEVIGSGTQTAGSSNEQQQHQQMIQQY